MVCFKKIGIAVFLHLLPFAVYAGITDTIISIDNVEIYSNRLKPQVIGTSVNVLDSSILNSYKSESLTELLSHESVLSVNSYGPGGLASVSMRGGASHHTTIIWNGVNIQSPMNGGVNLSTFPVALVDEVTIQSGGSCTLFGSGTATGSIQLENNLTFNSGFHGQAGIANGSAHNNIQQINLINGNKNSAFSLRLIHQLNKNDFVFLNDHKNGSPSESIEHAGFNQLGGALGFKARLGEVTFLGFDLLALELNKEIPAIMSDYKPGNSQQNDRNLMYSLYVNSFLNAWSISFRTGGFANQILYNKLSNPEIHNNNRSYTMVNSAKAERTIAKGIDLGGLFEQKYEQANSGSYDSLHKRSTYAAVFSFSYRSIQGMYSSLSIRNEIIEGVTSPISFTAGTEIPVYLPLTFKAHISKNYSTPTFNDLYWKQEEGARGNPHLVAEQGWSFETGLYYSKHLNRFVHNVSLVGYANYIDNWIRWLPDSNNIWTPQNILKGESKGLEASALSCISYGKTIFEAGIKYAFTHAVSRKTTENIVIPKAQLWYVPIHQVSLSAKVNVKNISFYYVQRIISERTYDDRNGSLPAYTLANIIANYRMHFKKAYSLDLNIKVNNIWGTSYQVHESYAMPLTQYLAGINFNF